MLQLSVVDSASLRLAGQPKAAVATWSEMNALRLRRERGVGRGPSTSWPLRFAERPLRSGDKVSRMTVQQEFVLLTASPVRTLPMSQSRFGYGFAGLVGFVTGVDFVPVNYVPPGGEILRAAVVVF